MPTPNQFKAAVDGKNPTLLKNALVVRTIYAIPDSEDPSDFVANTDGQVTLGLAFGGGVFWLDPLDTTTPHDGVTVIVTDDGYRYKLSDLVIPHAVKAINETAPPVSPSIGDAYLTAAAPTGAWAGHGEEIAIYTSRGWVFMLPKVGQLIYVSDGTKRWVFLDENGDIVERFDYQDETIPDGALIGGQRRFIVESQTENTPPGSPGLGVYWIVGSSPTGAWSGHVAEIATSYDGTNWIFIAPVDGLLAYDRALAKEYRYEIGTGWVSATGSWISLRFSSTGAVATAVGSTLWGGVSAPVSTNRHAVGNTSFTFSSRSGRLLKITISLSQSPSNTIGYAVVRDSETTALDWVAGSEPTATLHVVVSDASSHTYRVWYMASSNSNQPSISNVMVTVEESA